MQLSMLAVYFKEIYKEFFETTFLIYVGTDLVMVTKLISSIVLFLFIFPHINNGMLIMKYTSNNFKMFLCEKSAIACYTLGFL